MGKRTRVQQPLVSLNKALLNPNFLGGRVALGGPLDCHEFKGFSPSTFDGKLQIFTLEKDI